MHETINGFPIIATYFTPAQDGCSAGRIILVDRGEKHEERYVVAWQRKGDAPGPCWYKAWEAGCYRRTLADARKEFVKRVRKEPA